MLLLRRNIGEKILIDYHGELIEIVVLSISNRRVRIGILAPQAMPVHRLEVQKRIDAGEERTS